MTLRVQLHSTLSRAPRSAPDGSYEIYSVEEKLLKPGIITPIATEISIAAPMGWYMHITSGSNLLKYQISVEYTSPMESDRFLSSGEYKPTKLIIWCINNGDIAHLINRDDEIGRLHLLHQKSFPVQEVVDIHAAEPLVLRDDPNPKIKSVIKSPNVWFKIMYRNDPESMTKKYLIPDQIKQIETFRMDTIYQAAKNKINVEAAFVFGILSTEQYKQVRDDFMIAKNQQLDAANTDLPSSSITSTSIPIPAPSRRHDTPSTYLEHENFAGTSPVNWPQLPVVKSAFSLPNIPIPTQFSMIPPSTQDDD
jgi:hypothetical protein